MGEGRDFRGQPPIFQGGGAHISRIFGYLHRVRGTATSDVVKTFFQDQDPDQDLKFKTKTKTKTLKLFQDQDQDQDFASQDQDLFVMYTRSRPKSIFHFRP